MEGRQRGKKEGKKEGRGEGRNKRRKGEKKEGTPAEDFRADLYFASPTGEQCLGCAVMMIE